MNNISFYTFYSSDMGAFSKHVFSLFWQGKYRECVELYKIPLKLYAGNILCLGMNDALIYHHCSFLINQDILHDLKIPSPPTKSEIINLYEYEASQEKLLHKLSGKNILSQPSILHKAILAARAGIVTDCEECIETGTNLGMSSFLFSGSFDSVETIEADKNLHATSSRWLNKKSGKIINCHLGNSAFHLESILSNKTKKQLIFLDAHYSSGITSKEYGECPLLEELSLIFQSSIPCTIVVDDIRLMGSPNWPDIKDILNLIPQGKQIIIEHDQMIIS